MHINSGRYLAPPPEYPDWLNPLQRQEWQQRGFVVWDMKHKVVTHLYASYAIQLLDHMRENDSWKTSCFIIGSPAYQISNTKRKEQAEESSIEVPKKEWVITNSIKLDSNRADELVAFLTSEVDALKQIAIDEDKDARHT